MIYMRNTTIVAWAALPYDIKVTSPIVIVTVIATTRVFTALSL